jgi:VanZ family protein
VKGVLGFDKLQHLVAYVALAAAVGFWFFPERWRRYPVQTLLLVILIASAYGVLDEIHQYYVPRRDCNVWDWVADTLGAGLGASAMLVWYRVHRRTDGAVSGTS